MAGRRTVVTGNPKMAAVCGPSDVVDYGCVNDLKRAAIPVVRVSSDGGQDDRFLVTVPDMAGLSAFLNRCGYRQQELLIISGDGTADDVLPRSIRCGWADVRNYLEFRHIGRRRSGVNRTPYDAQGYERLMKAGMVEEALDVLRAAVYNVDVRRLLVRSLLKLADTVHRKEAFELCSNSPGDPELSVILARLYCDCDVVEKDVDMAISIMESTDFDSVPRSYPFLVSLYRERNIPGDGDRIIRLCQLKCGLDPVLHEELGKVYDEGTIVPRDIEVAIGNFEAAASCNLGYSRNRLVDLYIERGADGDSERAYRICSAHSSSGNQWATARLARMYRDGIYVEKDIARAMELMRSAADAGVPWAVTELRALEAESNDGYFPGILDTARKMLGSGDVDGALSMTERAFGSKEDSSARILYSDTVMEKDPGRAFSVLVRASCPDDPLVCGRLARMYRSGTGVGCDIRESVRLYRISAAAGVGWARLELSDVLLASGDVPSVREALSLLVEDALCGVMWARIKLARIYVAGPVVEPDTVLARVLLKDAADQGIPAAVKELGALEKRYGVLEGGIRP